MSLFVPKDRRSLFRQFLTGMYDAVIIADPNGHILDVNPRAVEHFGRDLDDVLDQPVSILIPGLKSEVVQRIRHAMEGDHRVMINANGVNKDGERFACEVAVSSIDLMNPGDLVFTVRNIERRREIMNSYRAKAAAFAVSSAALFTADSDGRITEANPAFLSMFDLSSEAEAKGRNFKDFMCDDPLPSNFAKALAGETVRAVISAEGEGGSRHDVEVVFAPNSSGRKTVGVAGSLIKI
jgi:PAS domain S-box-containing protein